MECASSDVPYLYMSNYLALATDLNNENEYIVHLLTYVHKNHSRKHTLINNDSCFSLIFGRKPNKYFQRSFITCFSAKTF